MERLIFSEHFHLYFNQERYCHGGQLSRMYFWDLRAKIWKERQMTILMVSHSMSEAVLLANTVIIMQNGSIKKTIDVNLNRPRSEDDEDFKRMAEMLLTELEKDRSRIKI